MSAKRPDVFKSLAVQMELAAQAVRYMGPYCYEHVAVWEVEGFIPTPWAGWMDPNTPLVLEIALLKRRR